MAKTVSGKEIANRISAQLLEEIKRNKLKISLAVVLIGQNPVSLSYIKIKEKKAEELGINFKLFKFHENIQEKKITDLIKRLNIDKKVNGIIIQLPIPRNLNKDKILNSASPVKDVDGLTAKNLGNLFQGERACVQLLP